MKTMTDIIRELQGRNVTLRFNLDIGKTHTVNYNGELKLSEEINCDRYVNVGTDGLCKLSDITVVSENGNDGRIVIVAKDN